MFEALLLTIALLGVSPSADAPAQTQAQTQSQTAGAAPVGGADSIGPAMQGLVGRLATLWAPNCDVPNASQVHVDIAFTLTQDGRIGRGPEWTNPNDDPVCIGGVGFARHGGGKSRRPLYRPAGGDLQHADNDYV